MNKKGLDLIKLYESFKAKPYLCPAGIPTIGYGSTFYQDGRKVTLADKPISEGEGYRLMVWHVGQITPEVLRMINVELTENQLAALESLAYNIGLDRLQGSTLLRMLNNKDYAGAADQFIVWNKGRVGGKLVVLSGLTKRRADERRLFLSPDDEEDTNGTV
jgi:lysozyme